MLDASLDLGASGLLAVAGVLRAALPLALMLGGTPAPVPGSGEEEQSFDPNDVNPGTVGFIATFAMVVVVVFLIRDMSRRVRRITIEGRAREEQEAAAAAASAAADGTAAGDPSDPRAGGGLPAAADGNAPAGATPSGSSSATQAGVGGRPGRASKPPRGLQSIRPPVRDDDGDGSPPASPGGVPPRT